MILRLHGRRVAPGLALAVALSILAPLPSARAAAAGAAVAAAQRGRPDTAKRGPAVGDVVSDTMLETLDGDHVWLSNYAGKVVLLDFWATWCGPCRAALPALQHMAQARQGQPFVLLSISEDKDGHPLREFTANHQMVWTQCWDGNGIVEHQFGVKAFPTSFVIDGTGHLRAVHTGWGGGAERELNREIDRALAALPAPGASSAAAGSHVR